MLCQSYKKLLSILRAYLRVLVCPLNTVKHLLGIAVHCRVLFRKKVMLKINP